MDIKSLEDIIDSMELKCKKITTKMKEIKKLDKRNLDMNYKNLNMISSINDSLNSINDKIDDLNIEILELQNLDSLNSEQKELLREYKFQQIFRKTLLPYVIYLRICMET